MKIKVALIYVIFLLAPSLLLANYNHILFYNKSDRHILLNAFPIDNPKAAKSVLFSYNDWHKRRYRDSKEIFEFFAALGFTDESSRMKFKSVFQTKLPTDDKFFARNWSNLFNWLSDMRIEEINGSTILLKEYTEIQSSQKEELFNQGNYFPAIHNLDVYLPKLLIEVNGKYTNVIDFGVVGQNQMSKIEVVLKAENLNNALLTINPINLKNLDKSLSLNNAEKSIFLSEYKSDTLVFEFTPLNARNDSNFWKGDTLTCISVLNGDYLSHPTNLIIKGIRDNSQELAISSKLMIIVLSCIILLIFLLIFHKYLGRLVKRIFHKRSKPTDMILENKVLPQAIIKEEKMEEVPKIEQTAIDGSTKKIETKQKTGKEIALFFALKQLYNEYADSIRYKKILQKMFGQVTDGSTDFSQIVQNINSLQQGKKLNIEELTWYKEAFEEIKEKFNIADMEDIEARVFLSKQNGTYSGKKIYDLINEYCYRPILKTPYEFKEINEPLHRNIDVLQKNREKLIELHARFNELDLIKKELKEFVVDVSTGIISDIKEVIPETNKTQKTEKDEERSIIDFESYLRLKNLFDTTTENFFSFLDDIKKALNDLDKSNISYYWLRIVNQILYGISGLSGINGCFARYESLNNPDALFKFFEVKDVTDCRRYSKKRMKIRFRDKFILKQFCWNAIQNLFRLYIYLDRKEFRIGDDFELFTEVKFITEQLRKILNDFDVYPHQINLFTLKDVYEDISDQFSDNAIPYLEYFKPIRSKLKYLVLTKELKQGFIYDVDSIGYEIRHNGTVKVKKYEATKVKIYQDDEAMFD